MKGILFHLSFHTLLLIKHSNLCSFYIFANDTIDNNHEFIMIDRRDIQFFTFSIFPL